MRPFRITGTAGSLIDRLEPVFCTKLVGEFLGFNETHVKVMSKKPTSTKRTPSTLGSRSHEIERGQVCSSFDFVEVLITTRRHSCSLSLEVKVLSDLTPEHTLNVLREELGQVLGSVDLLGEEDDVNP